MLLALATREQRQTMGWYLIGLEQRLSFHSVVGVCGGVGGFAAKYSIRVNLGLAELLHNLGMGIQRRQNIGETRPKRGKGDRRLADRPDR